MIKKSTCILLAIILLISLALSCSDSDEDVAYVGSVKSDKYHKPSCRWAKRIYEENKITFSSVEEAQKAGYVACKVCKP